LVGGLFITYDLQSFYTRTTDETRSGMEKANPSGDSQNQEIRIS